MDAPVTHSTVEAFCQAYTERDHSRLAAFLADDIEWQMDGPVGIFPFCGHRRGKAAVLDFFIRLKPAVFASKRMDIEDIVVEGNRAATFAKLTAEHRETGRVIVFHAAHFFTFRDGRVVSMHCLADTFDAVEQVVGHRIDAYHEAEVRNSEDIVAI